MTVNEAMTTQPATCGPATNLAAATELMWTRDCGSLPVVDEAGQVLGIVTDRDMLIALGTRNQRASELAVAEVMTAPALTCRPLDTMEAALTRMNAQQIRRLPVVDSEGVLVGMLTMNDIVLHAERKGAREHAVPDDRVMAALKGICGHAQTARRAYLA